MPWIAYMWKIMSHEIRQMLSDDSTKYTLAGTQKIFKPFGLWQCSCAVKAH